MMLRIRKIGIVNWRQAALNSEQLESLILLGQWCHRRRRMCG
jgi:hypothetical protein